MTFFSKILTVFLTEVDVEVSASFNFSSIFEINGVVASGNSNLFERLLLNKGFAISSKKFGLTFLVSLISKFSNFSVNESTSCFLIIASTWVETILTYWDTICNTWFV